MLKLQIETRRWIYRAKLCALILALTHSPLFAKNLDETANNANSELSEEPTLPHASDFEIALQKQRFDSRLNTKLQQLYNERIEYQQFFKEAYMAFPELPEGLLEAIAYSASRWSNNNVPVFTKNSNGNTHPIHKSASSIQHGHTERPKAYGVMGLYHNTPLFRDVASEAANAYNVSVNKVLTNPRTNILATAALLDQWRGAHSIFSPTLEEMAPLLQQLSGLQSSNLSKSQMNHYAVNSYVYDVLLAAKQGVDDQGIHVPQINVNWKKVFDQKTLLQLKAPMLEMDLENDKIEIPGYEFNKQSETYEPKNDSDNLQQNNKQSHKQSPKQNHPEQNLQDYSPIQLLSTDYGPALYQQSPYHSSRGSNSVSSVTIHTTQGSYAGTISWFKNNPYSVSAHYVIRSSDGQITQMVREYRKAHHVGVHNGYTLGIEHEGFVSNPSYYTSNMYNASANLVKHFCSRWGINCTKTYSGSASSGIVVLPSSIQIKGHQHYSSQNHTDPGIYWNWASYYSRINGSTNPKSKILDSFESDEGHFTYTPAYSGSTQGISTYSTAERTSSISRNGSYSEQIKLVDNSYSNDDWQVRFLSGGGSSSNNVALSKAGGRIGFWVYSGGSGLSAAIGVDDSDGTERTIAKNIPANQWTYLEWKLDDSAEWNAWVGGNGIISSSSVTMDAIWFYRAQTSYNVYLYIDDVQYRFEG
ncbi:MAG: N-acetylmuramoyl-L-alanine amidase [Gammaproteobacteria bacterium]|nr:N-acetylmuramoyl-L-alanine amidase [Gammaproteobacteria bacterium]